MLPVSHCFPRPARTESRHACEVQGMTPSLVHLNVAARWQLATAQHLLDKVKVGAVLRRATRSFHICVRAPDSPCSLASAGWSDTANSSLAVRVCLHCGCSLLPTCRGHVRFWANSAATIRGPLALPSLAFLRRRRRLPEQAYSHVHPMCCLVADTTLG